MNALPETRRKPLPSGATVTGSSGGGTQTMILAALDDRIALSFPAVMVSTAMQGGCTCENASLLRLDRGNVDFAGMFAPKPQGMTTANDWTKEMATKGFPELLAHYKVMGAPNNVMLHRGEHFQHNYNAVARSAFFTWVNQHFKLGLKSPVVERDYQRLTRAELTVWDDKHPAPKADDIDFERKLLRWWADDAEKQLQASASSLDAFRQLAGNGVEAVLGRTFASAGKVAWELKDKKVHGNYVEMTGLLRNETHGEELPVAWLYPKQWNGRAVIWLDDSGKAALFNADGSVKPEVKSLVDSGATVLGADLLFQGEFNKDGKFPTQNRVVANPREFAEVTSTTDALAPIANATGGDARRLSEAEGPNVNLPRIVAMRSNDMFKGDDWVGLKMRDASVVRGIGVLPMFAGLLGLLLLVGSLALTWAREGR